MAKATDVQTELAVVLVDTEVESGTVRREGIERVQLQEGTVRAFEFARPIATTGHGPLVPAPPENLLALKAVHCGAKLVVETHWTILATQATVDKQITLLTQKTRDPLIPPVRSSIHFRAASSVLMARV